VLGGTCHIAPDPDPDPVLSVALLDPFDDALFDPEPEEPVEPFAPEEPVPSFELDEAEPAAGPATTFEVLALEVAVGEVAVGEVAVGEVAVGEVAVREVAVRAVLVLAAAGAAAGWAGTAACPPWLTALAEPAFASRPGTVPALFWKPAITPLPPSGTASSGPTAVCDSPTTMIPM
jgi:hypothetical protein